MAEQPSIHYRRRGFYALWCALLLLSLAALAYWETPARRELATLQVALKISGAPEGTRVQAWAGPWREWRGAAWNGENAFADASLQDDGLTLPPVRMHIAWRRWNQGYLNRGTWDLVMVKLTPPGGAPRYIPLPLSQDIRVHLLRPKHKLLTSITYSWTNLGVDPGAPLRIP